MTNPATQWIIGLIDRLTARFTQTGFAYAYEVPNDQHVVQLSEEETFGDEAVRLVLFEEWERFQEGFPDETLLFIGPDNAFSVENPAYKVSARSTGFELTTLDATAESVLNSVNYGWPVRQLPVVLVGQPEPPALNYSYAMAA